MLHEASTHTPAHVVLAVCHVHALSHGKLLTAQASTACEFMRHLQDACCFYWTARCGLPQFMSTVFSASTKQVDPEAQHTSPPEAAASSRMLFVLHSCLDYKEREFQQWLFQVGLFHNVSTPLLLGKEAPGPRKTEGRGVGPSFSVHVDCCINERMALPGLVSGSQFLPSFILLSHVTIKPVNLTSSLCEDAAS